MKVYFFGVIDSQNKGHFLYMRGGRQTWHEQDREIPFRYTILDAGLLPPYLPEEQGRLHLAQINGWTVLGMWDRTGDSRGQSNASFIAEGIYTLGEMKEIAMREFPQQWSRIQQLGGA